MPNAQSVNHDLGKRLQALALAELSDVLKKTGSKVEFKITQKTIAAIAGVSQKTVSRLRQQARNCGYNPEISTELKLEYVQDAPRSGGPSKLTSKIEAAIVRTIEDKDRNQRAKPAALLGYENKVSASTMLQILKRNRFNPCKTTKKSGLTEKMKKTRLMFCKMYKHWTLED